MEMEIELVPNEGHCLNYWIIMLEPVIAFAAVTEQTTNYGKDPCETQLSDGWRCYG